LTIGDLDDRRRVAATGVSDLQSGAEPGRADGPHDLLKGHRTAAAAAWGHGASSHQSDTASGLGPIERSSPPSPGACPRSCVPIAWSPRAPSCTGIAASCATGGPTRTDPDAHPSTPPSMRWWSGWQERTRVGLLQTPGRAASARPPRRRLDHPPHPAPPLDPTGATAAHRLQLASVPANPGQHDVGRWVGHGAERYPERRLGGEEPDRAACLRA
jgi:hypothetical protein